MLEVSTRSLSWPLVRELNAAEFPPLGNGTVGSVAMAALLVLLTLRPLENPGSCWGAWSKAVADSMSAPTVFMMMDLTFQRRILSALTEMAMPFSKRCPLILFFARLQVVEARPSPK
jgi:hypothetical protein